MLVGIQVNEPLPLTELAARLGMDRTTVTRNLRPLQARRLVRTRAGRRDARVREVSLTGKGRRVLARALPYWARAQRQMIEGLGGEGWRALRTSLDRTVRAAEGVT